jgi:hypothetical protein
MDTAEAVLKATQSILLVDWPSRDVPDTLARAGFTVVAQEGPDAYVTYARVGDRVEPRAGADRPASADLVYAYRPLDELPDIIVLAGELGAGAIWLQSAGTAGEFDVARQAVEGAGMVFVSGLDIADAVRSKERVR